MPVVIATERTILRPPRRSDGPEIAGLLGGLAEEGRGGDVLDLGGMRRTWCRHKVGVWAMACRGTGRMLGLVGCPDPGRFAFLAVSWFVDPAFRGRGFAAEGAAAVVRLCRDRFPDRSVLSIVEVGNAASTSVALKAGGEPGEVLDLPHGRFRIYRYPRAAEADDPFGDRPTPR
jgi:GNAT superfamily N-acetyltransferase